MVMVTPRFECGRKQITEKLPAKQGVFYLHYLDLFT
jgi:hypothetical protein